MMAGTDFASPAYERNNAEASMTVVTKKEYRLAATDARAMGICSTCNHVDICTGRATWVGPVHHCEEFDNSGPQSKQPTLKAAAEPANEVAPSAMAGARSGLCVNCAHRDSCTFPIVEGGVWHCEEYE